MLFCKPYVVNHNLFFNLQRKCFIKYLYEIGDTRAKAMEHAKMPTKVFNTSCRTEKNGVDCGVFTMRNMECYKGEPEGVYETGLPEEGKDQINMLKKLRGLYTYQILTSDLNIRRKEVIDKAKEYFKKYTSNQRVEHWIHAKETIEERLHSLF